MAVGAFYLKSSIFIDISRVEGGVLGGPVAFAAPQIASRQASLGVDIQLGDPINILSELPDTSAELSTGSLDGAGFLEKDTVSETQENPSLTEVNHKLIKATEAITAKSTTPRYFIQPTSGRNWGVLHNHNAVDIANSCGTPVLAAADGVVVSDPNLGDGNTGWNSGYGDFILIQHPNGTKTRYAHLSKVEVRVGDKVEQGQEIGQIGNTGHVQGETGCHLHFEVMGASNPFARA